MKNKTKLYELATNESENDFVTQVSISDQGYALVVSENKLRVFSVTQGLIADFSEAPIIRWPHNAYHAVVATSDNGGVIAGGTEERRIIFIQGSQSPSIYDKPDGEVNDITISSNGKVIVLATDFGGLEIYNDSGKLKFQHYSQYSGVTSNVSISSDGKNVGCIFQKEFHLYVLP